eukprot:scaffold147281_cov27-Tisochrysis_lutea.AAC.1
MWWAEWRRGCGAAGCEWQMADGSCSMRCMTHPEHGGDTGTETKSRQEWHRGRSGDGLERIWDTKRKRHARGGEGGQGEREGKK